MTKNGHATDTDVERYLRLFDRPTDAIQAIRNHLESAKLRALKKQNAPDANAPVVVSTRNLYRSYRIGKRPVDVLRDVSLDVRQGEFIALTGPSGSGKSTLLQIIGGLDKPTSGEVLIDNTDLAKFTDSELSQFRNQTIGFVFQFFYLQPFLNVRQNIEVPGMFVGSKRKARHASTEKVAKAVGLEDHLLHMPSELSGGQMQRVAIARALLNQPKILLADEPTGNLDSKTSEMMIDLFEKIRQEFNTTIIVVTHDNYIARQADREIRIIDGRIS